MENKDENVDYKGLAILIGTSVTLALITNDIARNWVFNLWCDFLKWLGIEGLDYEGLSTIGMFLSAFATFVMAYFAYRNLESSRKQTEATQEQVENATEQLKQRWRAVPTLISPPSIAFNEFRCKKPNDQIIQGHSLHLLLKNFGEGPAIGVCLYLDPTYFQFKVEGSIKTKLPRPLAPEKIYEIQLAAIEMQEVDEGVWSSRQFSLNKKFSESEEIISDCVSKLKFDRGPALPRDIKLAITFEDITGQRRWIKYTKESTGSTKHIHGEGVPEFLKDD